MTASLLGISGSLRAGSFNTGLLRTAETLLDDDVHLTLHPLDDIPLYNGDVEREIGFPPPVQALRDAVAAADGLLLGVPEYNWSLPGVLKNAIDWLSRAPDSPLDGSIAGVMSAAGGSGGARSQKHLVDVVAHNGVTLVDPALQVAKARDHFTDGLLTSPEHLETMQSALDAVLATIVERRNAHQPAE